MRFSAAFRLVWIDAVLQRGERRRRADLVEAFGISVPQASSDLAAYRRLFPGAARYDKGKKGYPGAWACCAARATPSSRKSRRDSSKRRKRRGAPRRDRDQEERR